MSDIPSMASRLRDPKLAVPLGVFAFAFLLRLIGIRWGLANALHHQSYHPDELPIWIYSQNIEPAKLKFTPGFYNYPTLYLSILKVLSDMAAAYSGVDPKNPEAFWGFVSLCHLLGRLVSAAAGAATATGVAVMARRWTHWIGALSAGLLIAVAPGNVVHSRFQTVDVLAACFLTFSLLFSLKLLPAPGDEGGPKVGKWSILSGVFAGLSTGTKYTGVLGLLSLWAALALSRPKGWVAEGLKGTVACFLVFLITTPGAFLDQAKFLADFKFEMAHTKTGHGIEFAHTSSGYIYHLTNLFIGIGVLLTLLAVVGLTAAAIKKRAWAIVLLAFLIPYYFVIGGSEVKFLRYTFPIYPVLAVGFGWLIGGSHVRGGKYKVAVAAGILAVGGIDTGGLRVAALYSLQMSSADTRDDAAAYLKQPSIGQGRTVGLVSDPWYYSPAVYPDAAVPRGNFDMIFRQMSAASNPRVVRSFYPSMKERFDWDVHLLSDLKPDYVVFSDIEMIHLERLKGSNGLDDLEHLQFERYDAFLKALGEGYVIDRQYVQPPMSTVPDLMYTAPEIYVWKRKDLR